MASAVSTAAFPCPNPTLFLRHRPFPPPSLLRLPHRSPRPGDLRLRARATVTPRSPSSLLSDSTRTLASLLALALSASKAVLSGVRRLAERAAVAAAPSPDELAELRSIQGNLAWAAGPLFFAARRMKRPSGYLNTPLTVVAAGMAKWLDIYSGVLMASNQIKTAAHARGGVPKCPCDNESRWAMEPADKITGISIGAASCVNSIKITFDNDGTTRVTPRYGGPGGELFQFSLMQDEYLTSVSGYVKHDCSEFPCVSQLTFTTNLGKTYGPYGGGGGTFFEVNVEYDEIKGFFGHATAEYLTAFGVYVMLA
ncbi:uncharacterized protein LOC135623637 [Musa acuminata AAA Group]|uniref:uncharacterized protein LOC135623637 n=1 Tax=Musa acuminata AAA Group TaxID=214697 RepID=UPI0031DF4411